MFPNPITVETPTTQAPASRARSGRLAVNSDSATSAGTHFGTPIVPGSTRQVRSWGIQKLISRPIFVVTMNVYGDSLIDSKREANSKVVRMVLGPVLGRQKEKRPQRAPLSDPC